MEARTQGNSRAINHCYSITAGVDILRDKTKLGSCLHGLEIRTLTDDISNLTDDWIIGHIFSPTFLYLYEHSIDYIIGNIKKIFYFG